MTKCKCRRALVRDVTKNPMVSLAELQRPCEAMGETSRRSVICHRTWAVWESDLRHKHLLNEWHRNVCLEFVKKKKNTQSTLAWKHDSLVWWNQDWCFWPQFQVSCLEKTRLHSTSPAQHHTNGEAWCWQHHAVGVLQRQGLGGKAEWNKVQRSA